MIPLMVAGILLLWMYSYKPFRMPHRGGGELLQVTGTGVLLLILGCYAQGRKHEFLFLEYRAGDSTYFVRLCNCHGTTRRAGGIITCALCTLICLVFSLLFKNVFHVVWHGDTFSTIFIVGILLEEYMYSFTAGVSGTVLYSFISGRRFE